MSETRTSLEADAEPTAELPSRRRTAITRELSRGQAQDQAQLLVLAGDDRGKRFVIGDEVVIGRRRGSGIELSDGWISAQHARIHRAPDGSYVLQDLDSRNGTAVNGETVSTRRLSFGDRIGLGARTILGFSYSDPLEEQLQRTQRMEAVGRLAAGVAHEFNNLLAVVLTNLTLLQQPDALDRKERAACVDEARQAAARGADLTRQLLDYSQLGAARSRTFNLSALLDELVALGRSVLDPGVTITARVERGLLVEGDRSQLYQVLLSLCRNACDAVRDGGAIEVEAGAVPIDEAQLSSVSNLGAGPHVRITVRDTGTGMPRDVLERAFEPFFTTKAPGRGTGLGLAMAHGIIRSHGGEITLDSAEGVGTTVQIVLPGGGGDAAEAAPPPTELPRFSGTALLVDDDPLVCRSLQRSLQQLGFSVLTAASGHEALRLYRAHGDEIVIVLLDVVMPGMDGEATFDGLRAIDPKVKVLISTGYTEEEIARRLLDRGALAFLKKPYRLEELAGELSRTLRGDPAD